MNTKKSTKTCWVNTHRVTLAEMEDTTGYPLATFPEPRRTAEDDEVRRLFWGAYLSIVALTGLCVAILAYWPN